MKNLLLITIVFPPEAGGGTIRVAKNAKYLPCHGWSVAVVTSTPPKGVTGTVELPQVRVYRAPRLEVIGLLSKCAGALRTLLALLRRPRSGEGGGQRPGPGQPAVAPRRRLADYVFIPDDKVIWAPLACLWALCAVLRHRPGVIYSTSPSPSTHLVGYLVASVARLPWVIEFRDPWIFNPFRVPRPYGWMERLEQRLEERVLRRADHVVVTSEEYKRDFLARYPGLAADRISFIPNGFDLDDFAEVAPHPFDRFTIVHTGTFYEARSSVPFLEGVALALSREPRLAGQLQVVFAGVRDETTAAAVERLSLQGVVTQVGVVPHRQSIAYLAGAQLLLLVPGPGDGTMPGKTYEYLAVRRPILALCEEGVVSRLVTSTGSGCVVEPEDVAAIADAVIACYDARSTGALERDVACEAALAQFDRREIARKTARLLDTLVAGRG
ncbi:glycosyltransferase [Geomonas paludis]|uniref:Glycosyltransferase n=1 Tax=Geomonas paludis TaxID=2740185 RepID=A0ABY4LIE6_9BACT|nr:glycosyltransferase [Geomonas paludis]UPU37632.1 glycosyltransferase [Geomonas paludis]